MVLHLILRMDGNGRGSMRDVGFWGWRLKILSPLLLGSLARGENKRWRTIDAAKKTRRRSQEGSQITLASKTVLEKANIVLNSSID
jgi:hypothetical protein